MLTRWLPVMLGVALGLGATDGTRVSAQTRSIQGTVVLPHEVAPMARRPTITGLGMPPPRDATPRQQSVVYLEEAPREAFEMARHTHATIDQRGETFVPHIVAIEAGGWVDFPNSDEIYHNVFSLSPLAAFDLGRYAAGQSKSVQFNQPGIVRVFCDIHSHMSAFVVVFGHRYFAVTDTNGHYQLDDVPAGTRTLVAWHERFGTISQQVEIPEDGGSVTVDLRFPGS